ncbi:M20 family metallopeptidase [Sedimentibacter sp.]|uniref:M20 family metallopeptidase n=1 Tax=Sedimentibacter sp. TaxID=1960295 RepID=UPI0028A65607|nr:M20 family metallopeptidase [Sedimentibacter sp.]
MDSEFLGKLKEALCEEEIVKTISDLVRIPSYNGIENQETRVAEYIHDIFEREGIKSELVHVTEGRCNVIGKIKGTGNGKTLLFTGHIDTVPPYDMEDPFEVKEKDGKLFGRGVADMKGPLACMIYAMIGIKRTNIQLKGDIIFAGVIDEEEKSLGTIDLLERKIKADAAIVGEPSNLEICVAHRGLEWFEFNFHGKTVHGGKQRDGINAILKASNFIQRLEEELIPKIEKETHPLIGTSSMNYGTINGGTQPSTVAGDCVLKIDRRWVPGIGYDDVIKQYEDIIGELEKEDKEFKCSLKVMDTSIMKNGYVHEAMEIDLEHPIIENAIDKTKKVYGKKPELTYFTAWSDGGLLSSYAGIPTIVFAPGDLETAHSKDEQIEKVQILSAALIYALIAIEFCE